MKFILGWLIATFAMFVIVTLMIPIPIFKFFEYKYDKECIILDRIGTSGCNKYAYNVRVINSTIPSECFHEERQYGTVSPCYVGNGLAVFYFPMSPVLWFLMITSFVLFITLIISSIVFVFKLKRRTHILML